MIFSSQLVYLDQAQRANDQRGRLLFCAVLLLAFAVFDAGSRRQHRVDLSKRSI